MPVTFTVATHNANSIELAQSVSAAEILAASCHDQERYVDEILQCAFSGVENSGRDFTTKIPNLFPDHQGNGFVNAVIGAYNGHQALVIRPDDVWLTILSQFNFFVNANAEVLRANFVAHEGKRELVILAEGTRYTLDFGRMSRQPEMVSLIEKNIIDPTLREWVLPNFTTTTVNDTTVAAVLMMATLKQYFTYCVDILACGIPRVTLEGEKSDWVNILGRLEKLKEYGIETIAWYHLLHPVISRFIAAFDAPESPENVDFWQRVACLHLPRGSGASYYSGWINAFNAFNKEGEWLGIRLDKTAVPDEAPELMAAERFWGAYSKLDLKDRKDLAFDRLPFHQIDTNMVPPAYAEVDVKLNDNGNLFDCFMLSGMVGMRVSSSGDNTLSPSGENDTVHPVSGWWICIRKQNVVSAQEEQRALLQELMEKYRR